MTNHEAKKPKSHEGLPEKKKATEKINLTTIKTDPKSPIQGLVCREEHKKLFEALWNRK
ncbi:MAG: hypothetical protein HZB76_03365 [Chlamydiae bacterium]|nr:hypothetical protein [Chlamydiota bacterium]